MANRTEINGYAMLRDAIRRKDRILAKTLILDSVNVNVPRSRYNTPLHWATQFEDLEIMEMLLNKGANVHAQNQNNFKPLDVAIQNNKKQAVSLLIRVKALEGENLDVLLLKVIELNNHKIFKRIIENTYNRNMNFDILFTAAISRGNPEILELILPYRQFSKPSDLYLPRELVIKSGPQYKECIEVLFKWNFAVEPTCNRDEDFIYSAVEKGHLSVFLQLLKLRINVDTVNSETGLSLLKIACLNKHYEIVENLLNHNASVNENTPTDYEILNETSIYHHNSSFLSIFDQRSLCGLTSLHIAVLNSDPMMTALLLKYGAKIIDDPKFFNITCVAVQNKCEGIVRIFLDFGVDVNDVNTEGKSLLHFCVNSEDNPRNSRFSIAKLLVERGAAIHLQTSGNSLLFDAVNNGHHKIAQLFIDYDADIQYINPVNGDTLLHKAIEKNFNVGFIKALLRLNIPVDTVNHDLLTPLHYVSKHKSYMTASIIKVLLEHNADIEAVDGRGRVPLFMACESGNNIAVKYLLDLHVDANHTDIENLTPLYVAAKHCRNNSEIVKLLLKHKVNVHCINKWGKSVIHAVVENDNAELIKFLARTQVNFNTINKQGRSPLHTAVRNMCVDVTENLIKFGANVNILDKKNRTPLQNAVRHICILRNKLEKHNARRDSDQEYRPHLNDVDKDDYGTDFYLHDSRLVKKIIEILKTQVIKLKVAGLKINNQNLKIVYNSKTMIDYGISDQNNTNSTIDVQQLEVKCEQEIEKMIVENIGVNDMTFYDMLRTNIHVLSSFVVNKKIQRTLKLNCYDEKFPLYIDIVRSRFRDAKIRFRLINSAKRYFIPMIKYRLTDECINTLFSYLNIKDIKMFIRAMKPLYQ